MANHPFVRKLFHFFWLLQRPATLGVRVFLQNEKDEILLVRHTYVSGWYLPGGGVETGETVQAAAIKELLEEASIHVKGTLTVLGVYQNRNASKRDHVVLFRCHEWAQPEAFKPNREIAEIGFFPANNLPDDVTRATRRRIDEVLNGTAPSETW